MPAAKTEPVRESIYAPPPVDEPKPKRRVSILKSKVNRGTISLDPGKQLRQKAKKEEEEEDFSNMPRTAFSEEQLQQLWKKYALSLKESKIAFHHMLIADEPKVTGPDQIRFELSNESAAMTFNNEKQDLLTYLREGLQNYHIQIEHVVTEKEATSNMLYTSADKYKYLLEKYPSLDDLRKNLDLDLQ